MDLKTYLRKINSCEESELKANLGIQDYFPIVLKASPMIIIEDFTKEKWYRRDKQNGSARAFLQFHKSLTYLFVDNSIKKLPILTGMDITGLNPNLETAEAKKHRGLQRKRYNMSLILHGSSGRNNTSKPLAEAIDFIGYYIIDKEIPACFPHSNGNSQNLESIVYNE